MGDNMGAAGCKTPCQRVGDDVNDASGSVSTTPVIESAEAKVAEELTKDSVKEIEPIKPEPEPAASAETADTTAEAGDVAADGPQEIVNSEAHAKAAEGDENGTPDAVPGEQADNAEGAGARGRGSS